MCVFVRICRLFVKGYTCWDEVKYIKIIIIIKLVNLFRHVFDKYLRVLVDHQNYDSFHMITPLPVFNSITLISNHCEKANGVCVLVRCQEVQYSIVVCLFVV